MCIAVSRNMPHESCRHFVVRYVFCVGRGMWVWSEFGVFEFWIICLFNIYQHKPSPRWGLVSNTSCWGGGAKSPPPPEISQTTGPISKFQTPFDSPVRELPVQGKKFDPEVTDDVTGQVKVRIFDFSSLATLASKISMLSANKANESAWIVSQTSVSIISCAL